MAAEVVASGVVRGVVSNLSSPVLNEFWLLWGVQKEKDKLQSYLSAIGAVLQDAERRQGKEMAVKDWLRKLKAAAYDAEDLVDEFRIEALRRKVENQAGVLGKVPNLFYPLVFRFKMAHKIQKLREKFDGIAKERDYFHFRVAGAVESQPPPTSSLRETHSNAPEWGVYGRDNDIQHLINLLIRSGREEDLSVIPIVGMGGVGKTTLAQLVYNNKTVEAHFDLRMWVYVSQNFHVGNLLKQILQAAIKGPTDQLSMDLLQARLRETLRGNRYLLVLDDVWNDNPNEWNRLKACLICGAKGSKILVTSRDETVGNIMQSAPGTRLGTLSEKDSWTLFKNLANPRTNVEPIGKEMVRKCDGLPLAVVTLGCLMSSKTTEGEWQDVRNSELWQPRDNDGGILPVLRRSYDHLQSSLEQCFAYCAVIPKGCLINKDKLIKQWIAQGLIHSADEENELLEEKGESYFNELLRRSLFQAKMKTMDINVVKYKMHDLVHDLLRSVVEKECFIVKSSMNVIPQETRHLVLWDDEWAKETENLEALKKCKKLRSMFLPSCFVDINVCIHLRCLRVLDLSDTEIDYLPNSIDSLKHLRYLDVSTTLTEELLKSYLRPYATYTTCKH